jgi:hypothetical protein
VALEPPRELEQNHAHGGGGASGQANKIVDRDRRRPEQCHDARAFVAGRLDGRQRRGVGLLGRGRDRLSQDRTHNRDDVGGFRDECRALPEQVVAAFGARIERGAWHREHFAALFERKACGDQRAGASGRLHHHDADRKPRDQPVAAGKIAGARLPADPRQ